MAVQAQLEPQHYQTPEAFASRVQDLLARSVDGLPEGEPRLVAFPEAFALPLLFWLETPPQVREAKTTLQAALLTLKLDWRRVLRLGLPSPSAFYHLRAETVWPVYQQTFTQAAKAASAYVVAGSVFSPKIDWEPSRQLHRQGWGVYNLSLVVSPQGTVLGRIPKVNLTSHERMALLNGGQNGQQTLQTQIGILANLICLDAFHESLIERADQSGAWLVIQPSANAARWDGPWSGDKAQLEGQVWLREGLAKKLVGRENLRYGLNPMLNGQLYELYFEGRSGIYGAGQTLALADSPVGDTLLRASVEISRSP